MYPVIQFPFQVVFLIRFSKFMWNNICLSSGLGCYLSLYWQNKNKLHWPGLTQQHRTSLGFCFRPHISLGNTFSACWLLTVHQVPLWALRLIIMSALLICFTLTHWYPSDNEHFRLFLTFIVIPCSFQAALQICLQLI